MINPGNRSTSVSLIRLLAAESTPTRQLPTARRRILQTAETRASLGFITGLIEHRRTPIDFAPRPSTRRLSEVRTGGGWDLRDAVSGWR
jgi:hypothetical protein